MCGIAGIFRAGFPDEELAARLGRMCRAMFHRGPDEQRSNVFEGHRAGFTAARLSIVDLEHGSQPLFNEDGTVCAVLNGEIYNHGELREQLSAKGHRFRSRCDTEVLVHLYEEYGPDLVCRLNGMYALAVYDLNERRLVLSRDPAGMKPLYFTRVSAGLLFASEIRALLASGAVRAEADVEAVNLALYSGYPPAPYSGFRGIEKVGAGCTVAFDGDRISRMRNGVLRFRRPAAKLADEEYATELERRLQAAVRSHLACDVPVGAMLSGGWDSSLIATYAAQACSGRLRTYSIIFPDAPATDEGRFSRRVAEWLQTDHHEIEFRDDDVPRHLPAVVRSMEEPLMTSPGLLDYQVSSLAARDVKVALTGEGSDELFAGYERFRWTPYYRLRRLLPRPLLRAASGGVRNLRWRRILRIAGARHDWEADLEWFRSVSADRMDRVLRPPLCSDSAGLAALRPSEETLNSCTDDLQRRLALDFHGRLSDGILITNDRVSMAHSLECRLPFLDRSIVDFAEALPSSMKLRRGREKFVLSFLARRLPPEIARRRKVGLDYPQGGPFGDFLYDYARGMILDKATPDGPIDRASFEALVPPRSASGRQPQIGIWRLLLLQCWWSEFFSRPALS